jgi:hypothetical protein
MHIIKANKTPRVCPTSTTAAARLCKVGEGIACRTKKEAYAASAAMRADGFGVEVYEMTQVWKVLNDPTNHKAPNGRRG